MIPASGLCCWERAPHGSVQEGSLAQRPAYSSGTKPTYVSLRDRTPPRCRVARRTFHFYSSFRPRRIHRVFINQPTLRASECPYRSKNKYTCPAAGTPLAFMNQENQHCIQSPASGSKRPVKSCWRRGSLWKDCDGWVSSRGRD